ARPSSVGVSFRVVRVNSLAPRCSSSAATCRLMVGWLEFCSCATRVKEPASTTRTKARNSEIVSVIDTEYVSIIFNQGHNHQRMDGSCSPGGGCRSFKGECHGQEA